MAKSRVDYDAENEEILGKLDIQAEYSAMGATFAGRVRSSGMVECFARAREEKKPSAAVNVNTGRYFDSASGENLSLWEYAAKYGGIGPDWQSARKHFADKVGVKVAAKSQSAEQLETIEFVDWDAGCERGVRRWCAVRNPGWCTVHGTNAYLEAFLICGGRVGYLRKKKGKSGEWERTQRVVLLPAYGPKLLASDPVAWIAWEITGGTFPIYRGKGAPPDQIKMKSIGLTAGAMMGLHGLNRLATAEPNEIELVISAAGPSDMLAIQAAIIAHPQDIRDRHVVVANASSETGDVHQHQAALFAGRKSALLRDTDEAGEISLRKWQAEVGGLASDLRIARLPWPVEKKHGKDSRDFLNGEPLPIVEDAFA